MNPKVVVMMSTYNGSLYLSEQIQSILAQDVVDVTLVIRDDMSSDDTTVIAESFAKGDNRVVMMPSDGNLGPGKSFMELLYKCAGDYPESEYFAFADQDDIWLPGKLYRAVSMLNDKVPSDIPGLYCSNQIIYKDSSRRGLRFDKAPDMTLAGHLTRNLPSGCTFVMNNKLAMKVSKDSYPGDNIISRRLHDSWIMLCCLALGTAVYDDEAYILYRIHDNNAVGIEDMSLKENLSVKWKNLTDSDFSHYRSKTAAKLLELYPEIEGRNRQILEEVAYYRENRELKEALLNDEEVIRAIGSKTKVIMGVV